MLLLILLAQVVDTTGWSPNQQFAYAIVMAVGPWVVAVVGLLTIYLKLRAIGQGIDGRMSQLIDTTGKAAKAEGKAEVLEQVTEKTAGPVQVVLDPDAIPGGRRRLDPPAASVPPDVDPSSHLP